MEWFAIWMFDNEWKFGGWFWSSRKSAEYIAYRFGKYSSVYDTNGNQIDPYKYPDSLFQSQRGYDGFGSTYAPVGFRRSIGCFC